MSSWIIMKIFSDCCVCFGILGAFPTVFSYEKSFLIPSVLCSLGVGLSAGLSQRGKERLSWIGLLLPLAALLTAAGEWKTILPVSLYCCVVILRRQFTLEYYSYRQYFKQSLMLMFGLYVLLGMLAFVEGISESDVRIIYPDTTLRYALVHLTVGVILQRQLRLGQESHAQGGRLQIAALLGSTAAVIGVFLLAEPLLRKGATAALNGVLTVLLSAVMFLFNLIGNMDDAKIMYEQVDVHRGNSDTPVLGGNMLQEIIQAAQQEPESPSYWWVYLVIGLLLVALILMLRTFRKHKDEDAIPETQEKLDTPRGQRKDFRRTNRGKVRHYYREYLRMEKKRGMKLRKDLTTGDILDNITENTDADGARQLREIYLHARYHESKPVTQEQAEQAKAALRKSRGTAST